MRVVAGTARGRRLLGPPSESVRPTTDKVREATFNALNSMGVVVDARILDLFAGTGACGIEALSRGAASAVFVDNDRMSIETIKKNLASTGLEGKVVKADALAYLANAEPMDVVFADPPYKFEAWDALLRSVRSDVFVAESNNPVPPVEGWAVLRERRYGGTFVTIFEKAQ